MVEAKKEFGQNFLKDRQIVQQIIQAMPHNNHDIVEIGPGLGDLTCELLRFERTLKAYEVDKRLESILQDRFKIEIRDGRFELVIADVLKVIQEAGLHDKPYNLVSNLPYNIGTNIILSLLYDTHCKTMLVMVQKEVAQKFVAKEKMKQFGALAILAQSICNVTEICDVPPDAFDPPPKVFSSVICFEKKSVFPEIFADIWKLRMREFEKFLKISFLQPRKTMSKNLSQGYDKQAIASAFEKVGLLANTRPHEVSISNFHLIFTLLHP